MHNLPHQPPKYRCPRCSTRTCSLPCSRRHKLWSQCSGVRDPAAYLKRSELATESAFDRDFNFITKIERSLERAEREAEGRGIPLSGTTAADPAVLGLEHKLGQDGLDAEAGRKRKRPEQGGFVKGEAGFLRGAQTAGVRVIRAPRGMSRNKANASKWNPKHKCLSWTVEWITADGKKVTRNCVESCTLAEAYDRIYPQPKERAGEIVQNAKKDEQTLESTGDREKESEPASSEKQTQSETVEPPSTAPTGQPATESTLGQPSGSSESKHEIIPHRGVSFYLHRPRTATKQPVLIPLSPSMTFTSALRDRAVLEFPTIYALPQPPEAVRAEKENPSFILEEDYLRTQGPETDLSEAMLQEISEDQSHTGDLDIGNIDEKKVLEVLKQDLWEPVAADATTQ
ncbi:zinc finger HIT domain-containing protein [Aspergillus novofumigatus IBT 16806]|uniref:Putative HIT finger domain protein n=1 Tax=Aspergillus novofumigatus (strain IBT 16806) TaxID=1392255 RepID=A0A2I1CJ93_ASPN1|nr:putative HIT finger domain protein [Aspergillus novofumigatus IBT 16806]PKX97698.1 putative HIT finger domain protein [Aspergillus novofumigatus IBT 16806]